MSEHFVSKSVDPLPENWEYSHRYNKEPQSTLGEVVVTDPRDPFVWLATEVSKVHEMPSSNGKQLLWLIYRMSGNMPRSDKDIKWRDERDDMDSILKHLSRTDIDAAERYQHHLAQLDAEESLKNEALKPKAINPQIEHSASPIKLHEPNSELILAAILQHLEIVEQTSKQSQSGTI